MLPIFQYFFVLLFLFNVKHFICDFHLQTPYMMKKCLPTWDFVLPLLLHCSVHAIVTFGIIYVIDKDFWFSLQISVMELCAHFFIDRIKASPIYLGRFKDISKSAFWVCLGLDQLFHQLCYLYIVYLILLNKFPLLLFVGISKCN